MLVKEASEMQPTIILGGLGGPQVAGTEPPAGGCDGSGGGTPTPKLGGGAEAEGVYEGGPCCIGGPPYMGPIPGGA